ncbi:hypothetical protein [Kitasatospora sp. NPDC001175]|uniref:hypothetical protein n=1 Tax=Kitasatospora sp. NPDC001175 TaxID=3157103 RepID=UPI003D0259A7
MEDFDAVAERLYGVTPDRFTAARNAAAEQARHRGERALADRIHRLRRPTQSAWLANLLTRTDPAGVQRLLDLGHALREAQERLEGKRMRELTAQRHRLAAQLVDAARTAATARGHSTGQSALAELEQTLLAATGSQAAADALAAGRLTEVLPPATTTDTLATLALPNRPAAPTPAHRAHPPSQHSDGRPRPAPATHASPAHDRTDLADRAWVERLNEASDAAGRAERDLDLARQTVQRLDRELERLATAQAKAARRAEHAAQTLRQAQAEAQQAAQEQKEVERAHVRKQAEREDAWRTLREAEQAAEAARRRADELAVEAARAKGGR